MGFYKQKRKKLNWFVNTITNRIIQFFKDGILQG